ncbi:MAG: arabinosyltransferase, partial [Pseudonocardiaceae bacterium]|nr:arabinosyltransferase [Pseudonocardiaceae bacterium]
MLTSEHNKASGRANAADDGTGHPDDAQAPRLRLAATVLGLLGALLAIAVPLLPVVQDTAVIDWPSGNGVTPVNAPLSAYQPQEISATVPCDSARSLDARSPEPAPLVSTTPPASAEGAAVRMLLQVSDGKVSVISRGQLLGTAAMPPGACEVELNSSAAATTVTVADRPVVDLDADVRPQVVGIYTALDASVDPVDGVGVQITPDTRFQSVPHPVKFAGMVLAAAAVLASLVLLHRLDRRVGRRAPLLVPPGWWKPTGRDVTVIAVLAVWVVIGGITSDDGYILTMIQARDETGYMGNYYRWFNVSETPFALVHRLVQLVSEYSLQPVILRMPSVLAGLLTWLIVSRGIVQPLCQPGRRLPVHLLTALFFLTCWLPYAMGL